MAPCSRTGPCRSPATAPARRTAPTPPFRSTTTSASSRYVAKTQTPGLDGEDTSYQGRFNYRGDRYGFQADHLVVEDNFVPEVGFVRRDNFRRTYASGRFSPRPRSIEAIRQFRIEGSFDYTLAADTGQVETRQSQLGFSTEFENSDRIGVSVADNYEFPHSAVHTWTGGDPPGRRLQVSRRRGHVCTRSAASAQRDLHGARRRVFQRRHPVGRLQSRAGGADAAVFGRAKRLSQLDQHAPRVVPHGPDRLRASTTPSPPACSSAR